MRMRTEAFNSCVDCCAVANLAALFLAADAKTFTDTENVKLTEKKSSHGLKESFKSCFIVCEWTRFSVKKVELVI